MKEYNPNYLDFEQPLLEIEARIKQLKNDPEKTAKSEASITKLEKEYIEQTKKIFSVEDHSINGGLGSAILEIISNQNVKKPFFLHGLKDFTQSGEVEELYKYYNLDGFGIAKFIRKKF